MQLICIAASKNVLVIVDYDIRNRSWKFQINIRKIDYLTEQSVKCCIMQVCKSGSDSLVKYRQGYKVRNRSRDITNVTAGRYHQIYKVMLSYLYLRTEQFERKVSPSKGQNRGSILLKLACINRKRIYGGLYIRPLRALFTSDFPSSNHEKHFFASVIKIISGIFD